MGAFAVVRRYRAAVTRLGGAMLVLVGLLVATGVWTRLTTALSGTIAGFEVVL
jgi:cytochrome c-type biogenesis protein